MHQLIHARRLGESAGCSNKIEHWQNPLISKAGIQGNPIREICPLHFFEFSEQGKSTIFVIPGIQMAGKFFEELAGGFAKV